MNNKIKTSPELLTLLLEGLKHANDDGRLTIKYKGEEMKVKLLG